MNFDEGPVSAVPPQVFFKISRKRGAYFIEDINTADDDACAGKNLLDR